MQERAALFSGELELPAPELAHRLTWVIIALFLVAATWAWFGRLDVVAVAQGKIVPVGRVKVIQPLEPGVVRAILVQDGQVVAAGELLVQLDSTSAAAEASQVQSQLLSLRLDQARLWSLLAAAESGVMESPAVSGSGTAQESVLQRRVAAALQAHESRLESLREEVRRMELERDAARIRLRQLESTLPLITERTAAQAELVKSQLLPRMQWLELEEQRLTRIGQRDLERQSIAMADAAMAAGMAEASALRAEFRQTLVDELAQVEWRLLALEQEQRKADRALALRELRAPVAGVVQRLAIRTVGGVVTPAQELMQIVPADADLEIEAWLRNQDVGQVRAGQPVTIKLEAFPFTRYGTLSGTLLAIAPDAVADEHLGLVFAARVQPDTTVFLADGRSVRLHPGMVATVEIRLGRRRVAEYLLSPVLRYRDEALRER